MEIRSTIWENLAVLVISTAAGLLNKSGCAEYICYCMHSRISLTCVVDNASSQNKQAEKKH